MFSIIITLPYASKTESSKVTISSETKETLNNPLVGLGKTFKLSINSESPEEILIEDNVVKNCHEVTWVMRQKSHSHECTMYVTKSETQDHALMSLIPWLSATGFQMPSSGHGTIYATNTTQPE